jgi:hypothetical protein
MHGELFGIAAAPSIAIGDAMVAAGRLKEKWRMAPKWRAASNYPDHRNLNCRTSVGSTTCALTANNLLRKGRSARQLVRTAEI